MRLRVKNRWHTHGGVTYRAGDVFEGTAGLLSRLPDRLEAAPETPAPEVDLLDDLRAEAEALGVDVDGRWGEKRLREEIEKAKP